jgi:hypothetical protein
VTWHGGEQGPDAGTGGGRSYMGLVVHVCVCVFLCVFLHGVCVCGWGGGRCGDILSTHVVQHVEDLVGLQCLDGIYSANW